MLVPKKFNELSILAFHLIIDPDHPRAKGNVKWYEDLLEDEGVRRVDMRRNIPPISNPRHDGGLEHSERDIYEALCRHEVPVVSTPLLYV